MLAPSRPTVIWRDVRDDGDENALNSVQPAMSLMDHMLSQLAADVVGQQVLWLIRALVDTCHEEMVALGFSNALLISL